MHKNIKIGVAPIAWTNDDMPTLGDHIPFEQCISEMAAAGYEGCEVGHKFPRDPAVLKAALLPHHLSIASAWHCLFFTEPGRTEETIKNFTQHMNFLHAMGAKVVVVCECGNSVQSKPLPVFTNKVNFTQSQWNDLISGLHHIGKLARSNDMRIVYHHHMGTGVQQEEDIDQLMSSTDPELVSLLIDTGHIQFAGNDPLKALKKHFARIKHVHLKDIRPAIVEQVKEKQLSFREAVCAGAFTVPGDGCIDFPPILKELLDNHYKGWWIIEAEQDPNLANPLTYARMGRDFIKQNAGI